MPKPITDLEQRLDAALKRAARFKKALRRIADCNEKSCEKYVAKVDSIAIDALVSDDL